MTVAEIQRLKEERAQLLVECERMLNKAHEEKRSLTQEEDGKYNELFGRAQQHKSDIQRAEALDAEKRELEQLEGNPAQTGGNGGGTESVFETRAYQEAHDRYIKASKQELALQERQTLIAAQDSLGGYLMPKTQRATIITGLNNQVHILSRATVHQLDGAISIGMPYLATDVDDPDWTTETADIPEDDSMRVGNRELKPQYLQKAIMVSTRLVRGRPDIVPYVYGRLTYKAGVALENNFINGDGNGKPLGLCVASANGLNADRDVSTGMEATNITADGLREVVHALKKQYRQAASCGWLVSRDFVKRASKLTDGEGRPLWGSGLATSDPETILGYEVLESEYCPNTFTSGQYVGVFGDFQYYEVAMNLNMTIQNLVEIKALQNKVVYVLRMEADGMPVLSEAFARVKLG